jgi:hypothetical protein
MWFISVRIGAIMLVHDGMKGTLITFDWFIYEKSNTKKHF